MVARRGLRYLGEMGRRWQIAATLAMAVGCSEEVAKIALDDLDYEYAFIVLPPIPAPLSGDGSPGEVRRTNVFARSPSGALLGERPNLRLGDGEDRFYLVTLEREAIRRAVPFFDIARDMELGISPEPPPASATRTDPRPDNPMVRVALPPETRVYEGSTEPGERGAGSLTPRTLAEVGLREHLSLLVPIDASLCDIEERSPLMPFAEELAPMAGAHRAKGLPIESTSRVRWVDRDRVLVGSAHFLGLVHRGGPSPSFPSPDVFHQATPDPADPDFITSFRVAPAPDPDGRWEVLATVGWESAPPHGPPTYSKIWQLWVGPEGLSFGGTLEVKTGTVTVQRIRGVYLKDVVIAADGSAIAVGTGRSVFRRARRGEPFERFDDAIGAPNDHREGGTRVVLTGDPARPFVAASRGAMQLFDAATETWLPRAEIVNGILLSAEELVWHGLMTHRSPTGQVEIWGSGRRGSVARLQGLGGEWQLLRLVYPAIFEPCASARNPGDPIEFWRTIESVGVTETHALLTHQECSALVAVRRSDLCVSLILPPGQVVGSERFSFHDVDVRRGEMVVIKRRGELFVASWPERSP